MTNKKSYNLKFCDAGFFALKQLLIQNKKVLNIKALSSIIDETIANADKDNIAIKCSSTWEDLVSLDQMVSNYFKTLTADEGSLIIYVKKENTILEEFENNLANNIQPTAQMLLQKYAGQESQTILDSKENTLTPIEKQAILNEAMYPELWKNIPTDEIFENTQLAKSL